MIDTLLRVLSNADLDWMIACGDHQRLAAGDRLLQPYIDPDRLSIVIEGSLGESFADPQRAVDEVVLLDDLGPGEMIGFSPLLDRPSLTTVTALTSALFLSLPMTQVQAKLAEDVAFAAHFYHAIALLLSNRLRRLFEQPDRIQFGGNGSTTKPVFDRRASNDVLTVFGELRDSDVDWLTAFGQTETVPAGRVLIRAARPVESLYILLDGQLAMSAIQGTFNPLVRCFLGLDATTHYPSDFATLTQGSMPGIVSFLDFRPLPVMVRSLTAALVFAVPRQTLITKLQVDDSFASRFYRVIAMQLMEQLQTVSMRMVEPDGMAKNRPSMAMDDEELDMDDLHQVSEGAKKFGWMLAQLGVNHRG
ncbi:cyclic nucleotide-binding domain-containing protein [Leptolyngbya sp. CCNP1308]|uniref:cyclic nucleotide-binding domain-containing protein n=1 Tax=Leptolyngbya sp. CCNP1308 TaxID=3110255 RepID=UPI002B2114AC|nr:cyclic nucleotide-binding domain-containing protein [Leptolyngbya sp. CCNP1308]MEA5449685.1 cyclic nucleotide-binding domain-containing protein [Leptolyngbya sp. CCNP1308]